MSRTPRDQRAPDSSSTVGLNRPQADRLLAQARNHSLTSYVLILPLLVAGLRVGSTIGARIEQLGTDRGHRVLDLTVKGGRRRRIPLPPVLANALDETLAERGNPTEGPLFLTHLDSRCTPEAPAAALIHDDH